MTLNWSILGNALSQDYSGQVRQGFERGQKFGDEQSMRRALADYANDPRNTEALNFIKTRNPALAGQLEDRAREGRAREAVATILGSGGMPAQPGQNALASSALAVPSGPRPTPSGMGAANALTNALAQPAPSPTVADPLAPLPERPNGSIQSPSDGPVQAPMAGGMREPQQASGGENVAAWQELARSAPDMFMQLRKLQGEERKQVAESLTQQMEIGGRVLSAVLNAPPEQQEPLYQQFRQELESAGVVDLPDQWDPNAAQARMRMGMTVLQALGQDLREERFKWDVEDDLLDNERADENAASLRQYRRERLEDADLNRDRPRRGGSRSSGAPNSAGAVYARIMERWTRGEPVNEREKEFVKKYELRNAPKGRGGRGRSRGGGSDLIGQVYQRDGRRIQYSKKVGGYVDLSTGQPVK